MNGKRASRFARVPVLNKEGKPYRPHMAEGQKAILSFLERNRYATTLDIHAFIGGDLSTLRKNIRLLRGDNVRYIKQAEQSVVERNLSKPVIYELDTPGIDYLRQNGSIIPDRKYVRLFDHAALASHGTGSIEAGIKVTAHARLVTWLDILLSKNIPQQTRQNQERGIFAAYELSGKQLEKTVYADTPPFGIELTTERKRFRFFHGIEADTGSEIIESNNPSVTFIKDKFASYLAIENDELYTSHFGFPPRSFFVLFLTTSKIRMQNMIRVLEDMGGSKIILFAYQKEDGKPGYLFKEDWLRAGHAPINLAT